MQYLLEDGTYALHLFKILIESSENVICMQKTPKLQHLIENSRI